MNSNKNMILLFIIIFIIVIGVSFYRIKSKNDSSTTNIKENKETKIKSIPIENLEQKETPKIETETKIPVSQARFDEIKNYILSLDDNSLPSDLSKNEKTKIEEIITKFKPRRDRINEYRKICNEHNDKLNEIENKKILIVNGEWIDLEKQKPKKDAEIKQKKDELANTQDKAIRKQLQDEINKLQDERMVIIKQIMKVQNEIGTCENEKEMYEKMLKHAEKFKQELEQYYNNNIKDFCDILLNKIYQITN